jgi:peptidoglycan hydrolase CwlO-like protein
MEHQTIIALFALVVSIATFIFMLRGQAQTATQSYVHELENKVKNLQAELREAENRITVLENQNGALRKENIELLRRLAKMPNGT